MKNVKVLLSLIDYLNKVLPVDTDKKYSQDEICETVAFIKLYQRLGGKLVKTACGIKVDIIYELALRTINGETVILNLNSDLDTNVFTLKTRDFISGDLRAIKFKEQFMSWEKEPYPGFFENANPGKTKIKAGNKKIPKQKQNKRSSYGFR